MIDAVFIGLAIFVALEAHEWRKNRRERPEQTKSLGEIVRSVLPQEKAEYMLPMNDAEFEEHRERETSSGELLDSLEKPWTSQPPKSPSLDS